jgi:hypothetical protein
MILWQRSLLVLAVLSIFASGARAQEGGGAGNDDLAKQLSNPVADLVSIPFQFNWENGVGPDEDLRYVMNIQPVVPFALSENLNLIARWIMPYVSQPVLFPGGEPASGNSDIVFSSFFSPANSTGLTWGIGPVFNLPTTTDPVLGTGKWSVGPTAVVLKQQGPWTYGMLANHLWSIADTGDPSRSDVNQTFVQPFVALGLKKAVTITLQSESTANWEATDDDTWTIPINLFLSKVTALGPFPFSVAGGGGVYIESPSGGPEWKLRTAFTLILPRKK